MTQIVPFENTAGVPAFLRKQEGKKGNLTAIAEAMMGFPSISIKGKVFHITKGGEKTLITKPDTPDEPAASIEVVILGIGPEGNNYAKQYYKVGYTEGSDDKPVCYSDDGIVPAKDATEPQASKCATCPHNVFGSKISESGSKSKSCADSKRLAVAQVGAVDDAMHLRVPAASLKPFREFAKVLDSRGVHESQAVVTKIGFDYTVAHPALTFKPVGFVDEATYLAATAAGQSDLVKRIIGVKDVSSEPEAVEPAAPAPTPAPAPAAAKPKAPPKPAPAPAAAAAPAEDDLPVAPRKTTVAVETAPVAAPPVVDVGITADLDAALGDLDFDD